MTHQLIVSLTRLISGAQSRWVGCNPETRQRIYYANHTSNLDALVIWALLPPKIRSLTKPVAAKDYWSSGILRPLIAEKVFHAILIERKKPTARTHPVLKILEQIQHTNSIIIFPEGGRFSDGDPKPFKSGLYHLALKRPDIELIPVLIDNLNRILPKGEFLPVPLLSSVTFGKSVQLEPEESKTSFLERARAELLNLRDS